MIGIPGQTYDDLADDIELFGRLNLDMIGVGPYLRHPDTPLADRDAWPDASDGRQVPANEVMTYKVIALARLVCPRANIPATTALATLNRHEGRELGLVRGANVVMPNLTPPKYRAAVRDLSRQSLHCRNGRGVPHCLNARIEALGRQPGRGRGDSANYAETEQKSSTARLPEGRGGMSIVDGPNQAQPQRIRLHRRGPLARPARPPGRRPARCATSSPRACRSSRWRSKRPPRCWRRTSRSWSSRFSTPPGN